MSVLNRLIAVFSPRRAYVKSQDAAMHYHALVSRDRSARLVFDCEKGHLVCLASRDLASRDYGTFGPPRLSGWQIEATHHIATYHVAAINAAAQAKGAGHE